MTHFSELIIQVLYNIFCIFNKQRDICFACNFYSDIYLNLTTVFKQTKEKYSRTKFISAQKKNAISFIKTLWEFSKSKIIVVDCSHWVVCKIFINKNSELIYLGHGGGCYKKMGYAANHGDKQNSIKKERKYGQFNFVISSTDKFNKEISRNYNLNEEQIKPLGLPRLDALWHIDKAQYKKKRRYFKVLFAPSFIMDKDGKRIVQLNQNKIKEITERLGYEMIYSCHPDLSNKQDCNLLYEVRLKNYIDLLSRADVLLTDRSSIMFDFSLTKKPIIVMDSRRYDNQVWNRALQMDGYNICSDYQTLEKMLTKPENLVSSEKIWNEQMNCCKPDSSESIANFIISRITYR